MTEGAPPLTGVRVVECGSLIAGPFCGQLLSDFGAEVIKVEDPTYGDPMRTWGSQKVKGLSLHWPIIARNKKSVTLDLRSAPGQELLRQLTGQADVLVENFRPGTLERWGLGFGELAQHNPRLVMVRVSGYGQDGPYADRAGFGSIGEAMGGIRAVTGEADRPPSRAGVSLGDSLAGTFAAFGTLLALRARDRTGRGQVVDTAIYEAVLALMESTIPEWELAGHERRRTGSILEGVAPSNVYPCLRSEDILIAANRDTVFARLAEAMDAAELAADGRFSTHEQRGAHQAELDGLVSEWTSKLEANEALALLHAAGVPAGRVYRARDMVVDPHFVARQAITRLAHPELGDFPMQNVAPRLSMTPGRVTRLAPELGEHNDEVFGGLLGLTGDELGTLRAEHVI